MVVAQIPLWILHSTSPPPNASSSSQLSGAVTSSKVTSMTLMEGNGSTNSTGPATSTTDSHATVMKAKVQSLLHLWTNATQSDRRRSAIYCCDISSGRMATGGGDGKVRIWSLGCLFETAKVEPSSDEAPREKGKMKKMGTFKSGVGGGYESSDSSCASSLNSGLDDGSDIEISKTHVGDNGKELGSSGRKMEGITENSSTEPFENVNNINSLVKRKNADPTLENHEKNKVGGTQAKVSSEEEKAKIIDNSADSSSLHETKDEIQSVNDLKNKSDNDTPPRETIQSPNGKKRKRAELISISSNMPASPTTSHQSAPPTTCSDNNSPHVQEKQQRLLCTLSSHSGSVLAIRFSSSGKYLASSGDDAHVLLYTRSSKPSLLTHGNLLTGGGGGGSSSNPEEEKDVEHWNRIRILRGHGLDVVGLAWAPDDSHLVSCSLDCDTPVCVWKLNLGPSNPIHHKHHHHQRGSSHYSNTPHSHHQQHEMGAPTAINSSPILHPYKVLGKNIHTSTVKGVAFDPAGKYVASSGDDPAICIWRAFDDWGLEERIDAHSGIFRSSKSKKATLNANTSIQPHDGWEGVGGDGDDMDVDDVQALASLSLFRRISFAPDGTHICGTNATLRGKNIAAMISRDGGWAVSAPHHSRRGGGGTTSSGGTKKSAAATGAANLVGHKQPVVSSRHCPYFFEVKKSTGKKDDSLEGSDDDDEDAEPNYSTLVALGDKKGFVTVWSTRKSRPIFKLQCSESRCTVTDISWGLVPSASTTSTSNPGQTQNDKSLIMIVSLLDGYVVALRFNIPDEVGTIISEEKRRRIFRLKYGIELGSGGDMTTGMPLVDDKSAPKLIENILQYTMEENSDQNESEESSSSSSGDNNNVITSHSQSMTSSPKDTDWKRKQIESRSNMTGKKRIRPVLMTITEAEDNHNKSENSPSTARNMENLNDRINGQDKNEVNSNLGDGGKNISKTDQAKRSSAKNKKKTNSLNDMLSSVDKAASLAEGVSAKASKRDKRQPRNEDNEEAEKETQQFENGEGVHHLRRPTPLGPSLTDGSFYAPVIPPSTNQIYSVDLFVSKTVSGLCALGSVAASKAEETVVASCANLSQTTPDSKRPSSCAVLSLSRGGDIKWRDKLLGSHCTALAACSSLLALGTFDGTVYLYGTSPLLGWKSEKAFRSLPPLVMSSSVVFLQVRDIKEQNLSSELIELLVVTSDGFFGVYSLLPYPKVLYKGSILAPMNQMRMAKINGPARAGNRVVPSYPRLARIQITECKRLLLILSNSQTISRQDIENNGTGGSSTAGGSIQGFVYNREMELWMRVSDNSFRYSDFYSTLPSSKGPLGILSEVDNSVRSDSELAHKSHRIRSSDFTASGTYYRSEDSDNPWNSIATRSHCEDRLACALALGSTKEFRHWLCLYVRRLVMESDATQLRFVVDMFVGKSLGESKDYSHSTERNESKISNEWSCWWLSSAKNILSLNKREAVEKIIIPEMSKNRVLQRLTNEIAMEVSLSR